MMVTFVSQCQKNALKKTRRVLDAFADRIGDNTWQTVITEDGLAVVKKILRQTASKNSAVSCHWIRSRARSEFIWAVGNKEQFDEMGRVAVNYTSDEIKIDESKIMTTKAYANTKQQPLEQHLFAVGYLARQIAKSVLKEEDHIAFFKAIYIAGGLHDIGKLDPAFQSWIATVINKKLGLEELPDDGQHIDKGNFTFDKHARHNEISLLLYQFFSGTKNLPNAKLNDFIEHAIYWHHAKPIREIDYKTINDIYKKLDKSLQPTKLEQLLEKVNAVIKSVNELAASYEEETSVTIEKFTLHVDEDLLYRFKKTNLPTYKHYEIEESIKGYVNDVTLNAKKSIARAAVISADRIVSSLSKEQLEAHIQQSTLTQLITSTFTMKSGLIAAIEECIKGFEATYPRSERNLRQSDAARKLNNVKGVAILNGPAGCGKTKIALEWALLSSAKKIIWVCPRVQVCESLFRDLTSSEYLPNARVEICTGELKEIRQNSVSITTPDDAIFSGDIVLTTIDQVINALITHTNVTSLIDFMSTHVVFDEYHEYIHMPAFNLLFAELVQCKSLQDANAKALLVSATPNYFFVKSLLGIEYDDIVRIDSFNQSQYQISFKSFEETKHDDHNPLFAPQAKKSIVISNTATTAQLSFIHNQSQEKAVLFHSKFLQADKSKLFEIIFTSFKKSGIGNYDVLRSGPVVQASLNITCEHMVTEFTNAENWLQRLGRLDRFGENSEVNQYVTAVPKTIAENKSQGSCAKFLQRMNSYLSAKAWYEYMNAKEVEAKPQTITQLYQMYEDFHASSEAQKEIEKDLIGALKLSVQLIERKVHDPICFPKKKAASDKRRIKKSSLRGDNRFVQMAICEISSDGKLELSNHYACDDESKLFAMSINEIESYDPGGDKSMLGFMHQKHHKIMSAKYQTIHKQAYKSFLLEKAAIDPEHPIYVSYTPQDLDLCNDTPHSHAIYYVVSTTQPIGAMSIDKLNNPTINED
jgi:CRISPR-associated endonuclease/helicase Cas3